MLLSEYNRFCYPAIAINYLNSQNFLTMKYSAKKSKETRIGLFSRKYKRKKKSGNAKKKVFLPNEEHLRTYSIITLCGEKGFVGSIKDFETFLLLRFAASFLSILVKSYS